MVATWLVIQAEGNELHKDTRVTMIGWPAGAQELALGDWLAESRDHSGGSSAASFSAKISSRASTSY
jgi:hypothetical protein